MYLDTPMSQFQSMPHYISQYELDRGVEERSKSNIVFFATLFIKVTRREVEFRNKLTNRIF